MALKWINNLKQFGKKKTAPNPERDLAEHYDISNIDATNAVYRMVVGQRSNGKTYQVCRHILDDYINNHRKGAYIRRYEESITPKNISNLFTPHLQWVEEQTRGEYNGFFYRAKEFYLARYEEGQLVYKDDTPFCITAAINTAENTKGQDHGIVHTICFDEFMTREGYLPNEFVRFCNLLSTLIRDRDNATIYMLANTVNRYCPYFKEMGLKNIESMTKGEVSVYHYGDSRLTVAVELCDEVTATRKTASKYFAFDNPQLQMITKGEWEFKIYPRPPYKIMEEDIELRFYIQFADQMLCGELIHSKLKQYCNDVFIFVHEQTKDVNIDDSTIMYVDNFSSCRMHVRFLHDMPTPAHKIITELIKRKAVCFSNNTCGELFRNWLIETQGIKLW